MISNSKLQQLFKNYKNLSEDEIQQLIVEVIKNEKNVLRINHPIIFSYDFDTSLESGGGCKIEYNDELKRDEIHVSINYQNRTWNYLNNRNNANSVSDRSLETIYELVETLCHEMKHAQQLNQMLNKDIENPKALTWLKERIVLSYIENEIYESNHDNWSQENDAYNYQFKAAFDYIKNYCDLEELSTKQYNSFMNLHDSRKKSKVQSSENLFIEVNGESIKLEEFLNQKMALYIKNLPSETITSSILRYEYNSDYSKKSFKELMLDKQNKIDELDKNLPNYIHLVNKINSIYDSIINNDKELQNPKQQQAYKEKVEQKERSNDNPESFKDTLKRMTFNISEDMKDEIDEIKMDLDQNYEKYINENIGKKKIENIEQDIR